MTIQPHIQWLQDYDEPTVRYRFFYAQKDDIGVEVVLNQGCHLQVGVLNAKCQEYAYAYAYELLKGIRMLTGKAHRGRDFIDDYNEASLKRLLLSAAQNVGDSFSTSFPEEAIRKNMEIILQNINDFLEPYRIVSNTHSSVLENFTEIFPEHQLYIAYHLTREKNYTSFQRIYFVKSEKGLPYSVIQDGTEWVFSTSFAEHLPFKIYAGKDAHLVTAIAFPTILKPKRILEAGTASERRLRLSFARINDFNPCLVWEHIGHEPGESGYYSVQLVIAPFPALSFHHYLQGRIELPRTHPKWLGGRSL